MKDLIGQSLGRYHILEQIGEGGMATVYKAFDTRLERDVAVKIIRKSAFSAEVLERVLQRFEREAKALAKLSHPNILKILDYGEYEGSPYLVLEYMSGGTLREQMGKPIPWQSALRILLPVARGLAYAHQRGIIHRDVKPSNILITESGEPMLTDFGIAKLLEADDGHTLTGTGVGIGTPEYMAPEQGLGKPVDGRADLYSLGIVFYELVTGKKPYTAETPMAVVFKHMTDPLPPPRQFAPNLPDAVEKVLIKALAKQPENRFEDLGAFARALEGLGGLPPNPVEAIKPAPLAPDSQVTLDEIPVNTPTKTLPFEAGPTGHTPVEQPHLEARGPKQGTGILKYLPMVVGALALLLLGSWLGSGGAAALFASRKPTQTATETPTLIPMATKTQQPAATLLASLNPKKTATHTLEPVVTQTREKDGMRMVYVPQGEFKMGSETGDANEKPVHNVTLDAYWIDRTEVTNALYAQCVKASACLPPLSVESAARKEYYGNQQFVNYPVIQVTWERAKIYCEWAGARLPHEAEWEKAARGLDGRAYPWGDQVYNPRANYNSRDTTAVGSFSNGTSPYGAYDLAGNVSEWVSDWYSTDTYKSQSLSTKTSGPIWGTVRVLRGGSWNGTDNSVRSAYRGVGDPLIAFNDVGFRCAMDAKP